MKEETREIGQRLQEIREKLGLSIQEVAGITKINKYEYEDYESGQIDIPVSAIIQIAACFKVDVSVLLTGETPSNNTFSITKKGDGVSVERHSRYKYKALAHDFLAKKASPFIITIDASDQDVVYNKHNGQEFIYVIDGHVKIYFENKEYDLYEGESVYFNAQISHAIKAENGERAKILAIAL